MASKYEEILSMVGELTQGEVQTLHDRLSKIKENFGGNHTQTLAWREIMKKETGGHPLHITKAKYQCLLNIIKDKTFTQHREVLAALLRTRGTGEGVRESYLDCLEFELYMNDFFDDHDLWREHFDEYVRNYLQDEAKITRDKQIVIKFERLMHLYSFGTENVTRDGADMNRPVSDMKTSEKENRVARAVRKIYEANLRDGGLFANGSADAYQEDLHLHQIWDIFLLKTSNWAGRWRRQIWEAQKAARALEVRARKTARRT